GLRDQLALALQSRTPQYGLGRYHPKAAAGHGRIALLLAAPKNGGITVCSRQIPGLYKERDILDSFTFLGNGSTDINVEQGRDPIEMEYHAIEIVLHFVQMAIQKPLPDPVV
ncbi:MAG: hypothetical protein L6Q60_15625, partial [Rhodocyclaceae bacterium]|nr:hypothetical protein [Rhodocyclaceae bacterium]